MASDQSSVCLSAWQDLRALSSSQGSLGATPLHVFTGHNLVGRSVGRSVAQISVNICPRTYVYLSVCMCDVCKGCPAGQIPPLPRQCLRIHLIVSEGGREGGTDRGREQQREAPTDRQTDMDTCARPPRVDNAFVAGGRVCVCVSDMSVGVWDTSPASAGMTRRFNHHTGESDRQIKGG